MGKRAVLAGKCLAAPETRTGNVPPQAGTVPVSFGLCVPHAPVCGQASTPCYAGTPPAAALGASAKGALPSLNRCTASRTVMPSMS